MISGHNPFFCVLILQKEKKMRNISKQKKKESRKDIAFQEGKKNQENSTYACKLFEFRMRFKDISKYQFHSRYLRDETLKFLAGKNVSREFFIQAENPKTRLTNDLIGLNFSDSEIERIVSIAVEIFLEEFENTGKVHNWKNISRFFVEEEGGDAEKISPVKDILFKYSPPSVFNITPVPINEKKLREDLQEMNKDLETVLNKRMLCTKVSEKHLKELFSRFGKMIFNFQTIRESKCESGKGGIIENESTNISCRS
jgi:hypothetical protein